MCKLGCTLPTQEVSGLQSVVLPIMLASKLLPEQEEQQLQQLSDLHCEQGPTGGRQQTGYVQVRFHSAVHIML